MALTEGKLHAPSVRPGGTPSGVGGWMLSAKLGQPAPGQAVGSAQPGA